MQVYSSKPNQQGQDKDQQSRAPKQGAEQSSMGNAAALAALPAPSGNEGILESMMKASSGGGGRSFGATFVGETKERVTELKSTASGDGSATVATSAGAGFEAADLGSYTTVFLQLKKGNPDKSDDELLDMMANKEVNKGSRTGHLGENTSTADGKKEALVIGNEKYTKFPGHDLPGAKSDAAAMASTYGGQGFTVDHKTDLSGGSIQTEVGAAGKNLSAGDELLVYFAGHGLRDGVVGVDYPDSGAVAPNSTMSGKATSAQSSGYHATIMIDACHSGALVDEMEKSGEDAKETTKTK